MQINRRAAAAWRADFDTPARILRPDKS